MVKVKKQTTKTKINNLQKKLNSNIMTKLGTLKVKFNYQGVERPKTTATITNEAGDIIAQSSVKKSRDDKDDKVLGRFQAFRKAMNQAALKNTATKTQRSEAWESFKNTIKTPAFMNISNNIQPVVIQEQVAN